MPSWAVWRWPRSGPPFGSCDSGPGAASSCSRRLASRGRSLTRALDLAPEDTAARVFYASWLADKDRVEEAIPHLVKAVAASPGNLPARYQLLDAYARTGKLDALQALVRETLAIAPDDATGRRYLDASGNVQIPPRAAAPRRETDAFTAAIAESLAAYRDHDFARSLAAAQQAVTLRPDSAEAHNNVAAAYASLEQWDQAIAAAEAAIRLRPDFQLARNNLAWAQQEKQKRAAPTR